METRSNVSTRKGTARLTLFVFLSVAPVDEFVLLKHSHKARQSLVGRLCLISEILVKRFAYLQKRALSVTPFPDKASKLVEMDVRLLRLSEQYLRQTLHYATVFDCENHVSVISV